MQEVTEIRGVLERTAPLAPMELPTTHIQRSTAWSANLAELWKYRELVYFFIWRDLKVRYRQTLLGATWAIVQPAFTMVVFSIFFGRLAKMPSDGVPYPLFAYAALLPFTFFANGFTKAAGSLVNHAGMIKKTYFPRLALPISTVLSGGVDLLAAVPFLFAMMLYYGRYPSLRTLWSVVFLLIALAASLGVSLWFAALNVEYRDAGHMVPFLSQIWLFATPIAYPSSLLPQPWRTLYALNPMVGAVDGFRWAVLGSAPVPALMMVLSTATALLLLVSGVFYFRQVEKRFADVV